MEDLLKKMSRYDPGTITSKIFSLLVSLLVTKTLLLSLSQGKRDWFYV